MSTGANPGSPGEGVVGLRTRVGARRGWAAVRRGLVGLGLLALAVLVAGTWTERVTLRGLHDAGASRLEIYTASLESALARYEYLPYVLSVNERVRRLLATPEDRAAVDRANRYLEEINAQAKSAALYVLDTTGLTRAASNWNTEQSFVGHNYGFRPYFQSAMSGQLGRFYAIGATTGEPGYFLARGVHDGTKLLGVVAVKFKLDTMEAAWAPGPDKVLLADTQGVVFLSSERAWKYKATSPLGPEAAAQLLATRQYDRGPLDPIGLRWGREVAPNVRLVSAPGSTGGQDEYLAVSRRISPLDWQLTALLDLTDAKRLRRIAEVAAGCASAFLYLLYLYLRQRRRRIRDSIAAKADLERAYGELERRIAERTADLVSANERMQAEVRERERAEAVLRAAQDELVQAGKLAALGQMAAGVTHELNQPLAALRTLSDNTRVFLERGRLDDARQNLAVLAQVTERMGRIMAQLKAFARKANRAVVPVPLQPAVANALSLLDARIQAEGVEIERCLPDYPAYVLCDDVRLEQVFVNLFNNALDAMQAVHVRRLTIEAVQAKEAVRIAVTDSGPGISPEAMPRVFDPFFTTKSKGAGLGLGLAICAGILRDCGGTISASNAPNGGARFVVELRHSDGRSA